MTTAEERKSKREKRLMKEDVPFLVGLEEVPRIISKTTHNELNYSWKMYREYWEHAKTNANMKTESGQLWETMCILAFMFNVGRIHGIRTERAKRRKKNEV